MEYRSRLIVLIPLIESMKNQLDAARNSQLIEDSVQVVSDGMLGNSKSLGNFAVLHAIGNQPDNILFAPREERSTHGIIEVERFDVREGVDQMFEIFVARPDLPFVDRFGAFGQSLQGVRAVKNTPRSPEKP